MATGTAVTGKFSDLQDRSFHKIFFDEYERTPYKFDSLFNVVNHNEGDYKEANMAGLKTMLEITESQSVPFEIPIEGNDKTVTFPEYALGFQISRKMEEDDLYGHLKKLPSELGKAGQYSNEALAADVLNSGSSTDRTGWDSKALFASDHPLLDSEESDVANYATTASGLSYTSMQAGVEAIKKSQNERGIPITAQADLLIIPPDLEWVAKEILLSEYRPDNANMAMNPAKQEGIRYMVWNYLTSTTAWFLVDSKLHDLRFFWRRPMTFDSGRDLNTGNKIYTSTKRTTATFFDWRGTWYNAGA